MTFYYRENELEILNTLDKQAQISARMSVLIGRRRIGKTSLALEFVKDKPFVYLFVAKKSEALLCESFVHTIQNTLDLPLYGDITHFSDIFQALMDYAKQTPITVIIDEFQEFYYINPAVYSELQCIWDLNKTNSKLHVIFIGSIYSMMHKIFESSKEPLFGRADRIIQLAPFTIPQTYQLLEKNKITGLNHLFEFYMVTGGVPKYLDLFLSNGCTDFNRMLEFMLSDNSPFLNEGRNQLIDEFGKDYTTYFSILELISRGKTSSSEIESIVQKNVSAYLARLEKDYNLIQSVRPIDAKPQGKLIKYYLKDNFLHFWFKYFHKYRDAIEIKQYAFIKQNILDNFDTYSGHILEKFFTELIISTHQYNRVGKYWERDGMNEIDIVAIDDLNKRLLLCEVKRSTKRNSKEKLIARSQALVSTYRNYETTYLTLSLEDATQFL